MQTAVCYQQTRHGLKQNVRRIPNLSHIIGDKWSLVIIRSMVMGASSFSDFLATPEKIATNILAERLRRLEAAGLIVQTQPRRGSIRATYALTAKGAGLIPVVQALARWGEATIPDRWTPPDAFYAARGADYDESVETAAIIASRSVSSSWHVPLQPRGRGSSAAVRF